MNGFSPVHYYSNQDSSFDWYLVIEVERVKEVMVCDFTSVAMFSFSFETDSVHTLSTVP